MALDKFADARFKLRRCNFANLQSEAAQNTAQAHLDLMKRLLHQLARGQHRACLLCFHRFAVDRSKPAQSHQFGNALGILAVRLHSISLRDDSLSAD